MLNLYGPVNNLGYGVFFYNLAKQLVQRLPCSIVPYGGIQVGDMDQGVQEAIQNQKVMNLRDPALAVWHENMLHSFSGDFKMGYPFFETNMFNDISKNLLSQMNIVFVSSKWAADIVEDQVDRESTILGAAADPDVFNPSVAPAREYYDDDYFTIVNVGKLELRKGHMDLLNIIKDNFSDKKIRVLAMWHNPFIPNFARVLHNEMVNNGWSSVQGFANRSVYKHGNARVEFVPPKGTPQEVAAIIRCANLAVYPTRAEGWGLPIMESMFCGIPTIATNYSGPSEFLTEDNSLPLNTYKMEVANDNFFFRGDRGEWAVPDTQEIAEAIQKGIDGEIPIAGDDFRATWTWERVADRFIEAIKDGVPEAWENR